MHIPVWLLLIFGIFGLWRYWPGRQTAWLFWACLSLGAGVWLGLFIVEIRLPVLGRLQLWRLGHFWPGFVLAVALAYFLTFTLTGFKQSRMLLAAFGAAILGAIAFAFSLQLLSFLTLPPALSIGLAIVSLLALGLVLQAWRSVIGHRQYSS